MGYENTMESYMCGSYDLHENGPGYDSTLVKIFLCINILHYIDKWICIGQLPYILIVEKISIYKIQRVGSDDLYYYQKWSTNVVK